MLFLSSLLPYPSTFDSTLAEVIKVKGASLALP